MYSGPKVSRQFYFTHSSFNSVSAISILLMAISIYLWQFQRVSRNSLHDNKIYQSYPNSFFCAQVGISFKVASPCSRKASRYNTQLCCQVGCYSLKYFPVIPIYTYTTMYRKLERLYLTITICMPDLICVFLPATPDQ